MAVATAATMTWGLSRIAFWLDEGATVMATERTWGQLWTLRGGPEAPLLPYYALLKVFCGVARLLAPGLGTDSEVLYRLPSVIVTVLAGVLLISWLHRFCPDRLVLATGALLLLTGGFSRYGQEARPYAAVLFAAVVCTLLWTILIQDPRRRWLAAYTLSVAVMLALHTLSAGLILAHLVAALVCTEAGHRRTALLRTIAAATAGLLIVSPLVLLTAKNGTGPQYVYPKVTAHDAFTVFLRLFTLSPHPLRSAGPILLLAAIGLTRVNSTQFRFVARLAACWALLPLAALMVILQVQPNLMFERYVLYTLPAWAILAGLGVVTLADLSHQALTRISRPAYVLPTAIAGAVAVAVALGLIVGTAVEQAPNQRQIRTLAGHDEDIRPALALTTRPGYAKLPIVVSSTFGSVLFGVYAPAEDHRLVTQRIQHTGKLIWPTPRSARTSKHFLKQQHQIILLQRLGAAPGCEQLRPWRNNAQLESCMPTMLKTLGYRVQKTEPAGLGWTFAVLKRKTPSA